MWWDLELIVVFLTLDDWGNRHDLLGGLFGVMAVAIPGLVRYRVSQSIYIIRGLHIRTDDPV